MYLYPHELYSSMEFENKRYLSIYLSYQVRILFRSDDVLKSYGPCYTKKICPHTVSGLFSSYESYITIEIDIKL